MKKLEEKVEESSAYSIEVHSDDSIEVKESEFDRIVHSIRIKRDALEKRKKDLQTQQKLLTQKNGGDHVQKSDILHLNVGGEMITARRKTLTQIKGSLLETLFSGRWENCLQRDDNGYIFLDVNPYCFRKIVEYLGLWKVTNRSKLVQRPKVDRDKETLYYILLDLFGLVGLRDIVVINNTPSQAGKKVSGKNIYDEMNKCIANEQDEISIEEVQLETMERKFASEETSIHYFTKNDGDIPVKLNLFGKKMSAKQSTLCWFPKSMLSEEINIGKQTMYTYNIDDILQKDPAERDINNTDDDILQKGPAERVINNTDDEILLEYPAHLFEKILDYLRLNAMGEQDVSKVDLSPSEVENFHILVKALFPDENKWINSLCGEPPKALDVSRDIVTPVKSWLQAVDLNTKTNMSCLS